MVSKVAVAHDLKSKVKKKTLFISPLPPPFYGSAMSSKQCLEILQADPRFDVRNIKLNYSKEMSDLGRPNLYKFYGVVAVVRQIRRLIKKFNPEVIYFMPATAGNAMFRDAFFLKVVRSLSRATLVLHLRSQFVKEDWAKPFKRSLIKDMLKCNKLIVLGPELVGDLETSVDREDIYVLANGIPETLSDEEFAVVKQQRASNDRVSLFFLSNMLEFKGWYKVLEACQLLDKAGIAFQCHFVGGWPSESEEQKFQRFVDDHHLHDKVVHHGRLLGDEKARIFRQADLFVYPTEYDACPRVVIEAMEYGLPVISTRVGTIPTLVEDGKTGYILDQNLPAAIFERVTQLMDDGLRLEMGTAGRRRFLEKYTIDQYREAFVNILNQI